MARKLLFLTKPPKPVADMSDAERDQFAAELVARLREGLQKASEPPRPLADKADKGKGA